MKIVLTSQGKSMQSPVDARFGRAQCLIVVDTETGNFSAVDNSGFMDAAQGAGIQTGKRVVELGAGAVITGNVGTKAFATLQAGNVQIYTGASGTVAEAVELFREGKLTRRVAPNVEGHWV